MTRATPGAVRAVRKGVRTSLFKKNTKRSTRLRTVPIVGETARSLLEYALKHAQGEGGLLFRPWSNVRRDLHATSDAVKIRRCSPNDLRRTCATWLRAAARRPSSSRRSWATPTRGWSSASTADYRSKI
jgi:integrase